MTDLRHSPLNTGEIRAWWEAAARSANTPTPHWTIPALCDEVDRLRAEMDVMTTLVRRLYTCDWADPMTDEQEAMLTRIVEGDGRG